MKKPAAAALPTDPRDCDREPVRFISSVQPHAALVAFTGKDWRVQCASGNLADCLGKRLDEVPDEARAWLGPEGALLARVRAAIDTDYWRRERQAYFAFPGPDGGPALEAHLFESEGLLCAEIERPGEIGPVRGAGSGSRSEFELSAHLRLFRSVASLDELGRIACQSIRQFTGMDRVMLYRFIPPTFYGEVVAEDKTAEAHSFMHHRFPASDIPKPARDLYLRNQSRYIGDSSAAPSPLSPDENPLTGKKLDLADSKVRGVSPIHLEYLRNMGVTTSFSVAVVVEGTLWGLIACHGARRTYIPQAIRALCESVAEAVAIGAPLLENMTLQRRRLDFDAALYAFFRDLRHAADPMDELFRRHTRLFDIFGCTGVAYISDRAFDFAGATPPRAMLQELAEWIQPRLDDARQGLWSTAELSEADPRWQDLKDLASGLLAVRVDKTERGLFLLFRPELLSTVKWGGDPRKLEARDYGGAINPRMSFESWEETIRRRALAWTDFEIEGVYQIRDFVFDHLVQKQRFIRELAERSPR